MKKNLLEKFFSLASRQTCRLLMVTLCLLTASALHAQVTVSGRVTAGEDSSPLPGVNILVKGTSLGTISDAEGQYSINVPSTESTLVFSFVGYLAQEISLGGRNSVDVALATDAKQLSEVVVTALGIEKDKKSLGYSLQSVSSEDISTARETNVVNQLAGKIAGVTVVGGNSGVGSSARVSIRGERSVILNKNQPLYVIDGVPISNGLTG